MFKLGHSKSINSASCASIIWSNFVLLHKYIFQAFSDQCGWILSLFWYSTDKTNVWLQTSNSKYNVEYFNRNNGTEHQLVISPQKEPITIRGKWSFLFVFYKFEFRCFGCYEGCLKWNSFKIVSFKYLLVLWRCNSKWTTEG